MTRSYGSKKQSMASKRAAAMQYLVLAANPTTDTLTRSYGLTPSEADKLIREEQSRRAAGSGSIELQRAFNG